MNGPRVAVILGKLGARVHGTLDARRPFDDTGAFATGTVSGFWGVAWALAEQGYVVDAYADVKEQVLGNPELGGADVVPFAELEAGFARDGYDAYVSILESDLLHLAPKHRPRICVQWLNDFSFAKADPLAAVDLIVSPSETHADHLARKIGVSRSKIAVVPLMSHPEFFVGDGQPRRPLSIAYASSPDRGLHHLLDMWPDIRKRVPGAELRIYYRVLPWLKDILDEPAHRGSKNWKRAVVIQEAFDKMGPEEGVHFVGPVTTKAMAAELCRTEILAYPCDPVKFTEGFSVTILDACAAGCRPIVSGVDAFPELWSKAAKVIPGRPSDPGAREEWLRTITSALLASEEEKAWARSAARARAAELSRRNVGRRWDEIIRSAIAIRRNA